MDFLIPKRVRSKKKIEFDNSILLSNNT